MILTGILKSFLTAMNRPDFPMLDDSLAAFLQQGLAINIGTRNARLEPTAARTSAPPRSTTTGSTSPSSCPTVGAPAVLDDLRANGQAAVVFARPEDDRACQVKGTFVSRAAGDRRRRAAGAGRSCDGFLRQLEIIGMPRRLDAAVDGVAGVAVRLRVTAVFDQTPGPRPERRWHEPRPRSAGARASRASSRPRSTRARPTACPTPPI